MMEIRVMQKSSDLVIPQSHFERLVHELIEEYTYKEGIFMKRIQRQALEALQEAAEMHLVQQFEMNQLCAIHANWVAVQSKDLVLAQKSRNTDHFTSLSFFHIYHHEYHLH